MSPAGAPKDFVRVLRFAAPAGDVFAKLWYAAGEDVADLAERVRRDFPRWRAADTAQVAFFVVQVKPDENEPTPAAITAARQGERLQVGAAVVPGSWLLARIADDGAPAAPGTDVVARIEALERLAGRIRLGSASSR